MTDGEVVLAHAQQQAVVGDAGVGHEHLDRAELAPRPPRTRRRPDSAVGDVARRRRSRPSGGGERVVGDGDPVAERGERAGRRRGRCPRDPPVTRTTRLTRLAGGARRRPSAAPRWPRSCRRRSRRAARGRRRSPGRRRARRPGPAGSTPTTCCRCGRARVAARSIGMPRRSQAASMMRMLAWWGTTRAMSSAVTPACVHRLRRPSRP